MKSKYWCDNDGKIVFYNETKTTRKIETFCKKKFFELNDEES